jgi:dTDP-4-dehydrorhamnose reductase
MRILLIGKFGQLGWELHRSLLPVGEVIAVDYPDIDLSQPDSITNLIDSEKPGLVINAAAYTDVDKAEKEKVLADSINGKAPGAMAEACIKKHAAFIHYSTDYVFDGEKGAPYKESDIPNPINSYGISKLAGEQAVTQFGGAYLILRTSWVYSLRKGGFVNKVIEWSQKQPELRIVDDQIGSPTWARLLAEFTTQLISGCRENYYPFFEKYAGVYHVAGEGYCSRYDWAKAILEFFPDTRSQSVSKVIPCKSSEFPTPAIRPTFTALDCEKIKLTFGLSLPAWKDALGLCMA